MKMICDGTRLVLSAATCGLLLVAVTGCKSDGKMKEAEAKTKSSDAYWPSEEPQYNKFTDAQAAAGAQEDASLSAAHFTGGQLNSLGQQKLQMMMKGGVHPAVVYLGATDDATGNLRRQAIDDYLKETGAPTDALVVKSGSNPHTGTLAVQNIARSPRADTDGKAVSLTPDGKGPTMFGPGPSAADTAAQSQSGAGTSQ